MGKFFMDTRIPTEGFLDNYSSMNPESFIHKKYTFGHPNNSLESTVPGTHLALERITHEQDDDAFFGVHIRETIRQFKTLFGRL